jgi:hypothetical protein
MSPSFRKTMLVLGIWIISTLACKVFTPEYEAKIIKEATQTAAAMKAAQETPDAKDVTPASVQTLPEKAPPENPDEQFVFSFAGENQSYHTGLRNKTVFYIDYETGSVVASEEASFEESTGTQTRRGTDSVKFNGLYDANTKSFSGKLTLFTQGTATGSNYDNTVTYTMDGTLSAEFVDGQWVGTVTGTSTLKQVWLDGVNPDEVTTRGIEWTLIGIPVQ